MRLISLLATPNQRLTVTVETIRYDITLRSATGVMIADVVANGEPLLSGTRVLAGELIIPYRYQEAQGNFLILTVEDALPAWSSFGSSQALYYLTAAELEEIRA